MQYILDVMIALGVACKYLRYLTLSYADWFVLVFSALRIFAICGQINILVVLVFLCSMFVPSINVVRKHFFVLELPAH